MISDSIFLGFEYLNKIQKTTERIAEHLKLIYSSSATPDQENSQYFQLVRSLVFSDQQHIASHSALARAMVRFVFFHQLLKHLDFFFK